MPLLLVMITSATAVADLSYMHTLGELSITDGNNKLYPLLTSVFASTLVHNIYCTGARSKIASSKCNQSILVAAIRHDRV